MTKDKDFNNIRLIRHNKRYIVCSMVMLWMCVLCATAQDLVICSNNVKNLLDTQSGYTAKIGTVGKVMAELQADVYCLQEVQPVTSTVDALLESVNEQGDINYAAINDIEQPSFYHQSAFFYRTDRIKPTGNIASPYSSGLYSLRLRIQKFTDLSNGETFTISNNHFKSYNESKTLENAQRLVSKLKTWNDKRVMIIGDLNSELTDDPCQYLVNAGYVEEVESRYPNDYTYYYSGDYKYIDHCFTSTTLHNYVVDAKPWHINVGSKATYRYSDHDPIIVTIHLADEKDDAVEAPETVQEGSGEVYDLQGRPAAKGTPHGIYIKDGRKIVR